jgi:hypothetical protein
VACPARPHRSASAGRRRWPPGAHPPARAAPDGVLGEVTEHPREAAARRIAERGLALTPEQLLGSPHALIGPAGRLRERLSELRERWGVGAVTAYEADLPSLLPVFASLGA